MTDPGEIIVTQRDRDAAADYTEERHADRLLAETMREGKADRALTVQAFARHRLESTQAQAGKVGELVEHLSGPHEWGYRDPVEGGFVADRKPFEAASTLASLQEQKVALVEALKEGERLIRWQAKTTGCSDQLYEWLDSVRALLVVEGGGK